jgi:type I restriction enzyme S subunit
MEVTQISTRTSACPSDWPESAFGLLYAAPSRNGVYKAPGYHGRGVRIVNMGEMFGNDFISDQDMTLVELTSTELDTSALQDGDLLFGRRSVMESGAGKCSLVVSPTSPLTFESSIIRARLKSGSAVPLFFYYFFKSPEGRRRIRNIVSGTNVKGIRGSELRGILVPVPSLHEQRAIATALSDVDALITSLDRLISKKRDLKQAAMQQLLTGKTRLPGFEVKPGYKQTDVGVIPEDWDLEFIENLAYITTGGKNTQDRVDDGPYPFFVRSQTVERISSYSYDGEAVLTAGDGAGTGKVFHYINGRFDVHQRVYRLSDFNERICGYFFFLYFSSHFYGRIMQMTAKSSVDSVRRNMIARMVIPLPASRAEQTAIASVLSDMDAELAALEQRREKTKLLKQGMMQELLTGRIRLI